MVAEQVVKVRRSARGSHTRLFGNIVIARIKPGSTTTTLLPQLMKPAGSTNFALTLRSRSFHRVLADRTWLGALNGDGAGEREIGCARTLDRRPSTSHLGSRFAARPLSSSRGPFRLLTVVPFPIRSRGASAFRRLFSNIEPSDFSRPIIASFPNDYRRNGGSREISLGKNAELHDVAVTSTPVIPTTFGFRRSRPADP